MSVKIQRYDLVDHGSVLATRPVGREIGAKAAGLLADSRGLLLNFHRVEVASPSFLRELMSALRGVLTSPDDEHLLLLTGMNEDVRESVDLVAKYEKMHLGELDDRQISLIGGSEHLEDTLRAAQQLGTFTATELAERLKIKLPALHQRLAQLNEAGVVTREDDPTATRGKRSKFHAPDAADIEQAAESEDASIAVLSGAS